MSVVAFSPPDVTQKKKERNVDAAWHCRRPSLSVPDYDLPFHV